ncbi:uncharacterized protein LOC8063505 [Sorghum bicolor]|nr:uncharacterized protein LOC8063505 [Sorghum bicolor]|eukprot:XP_002463223.2 uncharacterized protein LOC8063505 [Sorghum bicolor]
MYGHVVERATLARDLLAPAAAAAGSQLSGDPASFHSRSILAQRLDLFFPDNGDDDLRADLARFGAIEAIALCRHLGMAVIVFRDEATVPIAFSRQEEASHGVYSAVPPPHLALPTIFIHPSSIKVNLFPPAASTTGDSVSVSAEGSTEPTRTEATRIEGSTRSTTPLWMESRPAIVFQNYLSEGPVTSSFVSSRRSQIYGPTMDADGHLWMDGTSITKYGKAIEINRRASVRVVQVPQLLYQSEADVAAGHKPPPSPRITTLWSSFGSNFIS